MLQHVIQRNDDIERCAMVIALRVHCVISFA